MCEALVERVQKAIDDAKEHKSRLPKATMDVRGWISPKIRHLLNNLCSAPDTVYLEAGLWQGASLISALAGNEDTVKAAYGIDNWRNCPKGRSMKGRFDTHVRRHLGETVPNLTVFDADCLKMPVAKIKEPATIFYYDADHYATDRGTMRFFERLASPCVLLLDDWYNHQPIRKHWRKAEAEGEMEVVQEWELPTKNKLGDLDLWWIGLYVAVLQRKRDC